MSELDDFISNYDASVRAYDGDTLKGRQFDAGALRVTGINAPELSQPGGAAALRTAQDFAGDEVIDTGDTGFFGRSLGDIRKPGGQLLSHELLARGQASTRNEATRRQLAIEADFSLKDSDVDIGIVTDQQRADAAARREDARANLQTIREGDVPFQVKRKKGFHKKAIARGADQVQQMAFGLSKLFGDIVDSETISEWAKAGIDDNALQIMFNPRETKSFRDAEGFAESMASVYESLVEQVPNIGTTIASALVTGGIGGVVAKRAASRIAMGEINASIATTQAFSNAMKASGAGGASFVLNTGETKLSFDREGIDDNAKVLFTGIVKAAADMAGLAAIPGVNRLVGMGARAAGVPRKMLWKEVPFKVMRAAAAEGTTEAFQAVADAVAINSSLDREWSEADTDAVLESFVIGAAAGGVLGGAGSVIQTAVQPEVPTKPSEAKSVTPEDIPQTVVEPQVDINAQLEALDKGEKKAVFVADDEVSLPKEQKVGTPEKQDDGRYVVLVDSTQKGRVFFRDEAVAKEYVDTVNKTTVEEANIVTQPKGAKPKVQVLKESEVAGTDPIVVVAANILDNGTVHSVVQETLTTEADFEVTAAAIKKQFPDAEITRMSPSATVERRIAIREQESIAIAQAEKTGKPATPEQQVEAEQEQKAKVLDVETAEQIAPVVSEEEAVAEGLTITEKFETDTGIEEQIAKQERKDKVSEDVVLDDQEAILLGDLQRQYDKAKNEVERRRINREIQKVKKRQQLKEQASAIIRKKKPVVKKAAKKPVAKKPVAKKPAAPIPERVEEFTTPRQRIPTKRIVTGIKSLFTKEGGLAAVKKAKELFLDITSPLQTTRFRLHRIDPQLAREYTVGQGRALRGHKAGWRDRFDSDAAVFKSQVDDRVYRNHTEEEIEEGFSEYLHGGTTSAVAAELNKIFSEFKSYLNGSKVPRLANLGAPTKGIPYFPQIHDTASIRSDPKGFTSFLLTGNKGKAFTYTGIDGKQQSITPTIANEILASLTSTSSLEGNTSPQAASAKRRVLTDSAYQGAAFDAGWLNKDPRAIIEFYISTMTRQKNYEEQFGDFIEVDKKQLASQLKLKGYNINSKKPKQVQVAFKDAIKRGLMTLHPDNKNMFMSWSADVKKLLRVAEIEHEQGADAAREATKAMNAMDGLLGLHLNGKARKTMQWIVVVQSYLLLAFSTLSSLPEFGVMMAGTAGKSPQAAWTGLKKFVTEHKKSADMARLMGTIPDALIATGYLDSSTFEMKGNAPRAAMEKFFKYNGNILFNNSIRAIANNIGIDYFMQKAKAGDAKALERWGITPKDVLDWDAGGRDAFAQNDPVKHATSLSPMSTALLQFVDAHSARPTSPVKPVFGNDPHFMLISQLKSFFYVYGSVILPEIARTMTETYSKARSQDKPHVLAGLQATLPLIIIGAIAMPLAALSQEIKSGIRELSDDEHEKRRAKRMARISKGDRLVDILRASGALGPVDLMMSFYDAEQFGQSGVVRALGPTAGHLDVLWKYGLSPEFFKRSTPVAGIAAPGFWKDAIREAQKERREERKRR